MFTLIIPNRVFSQCPPSLFIAPINPVCFNQTSINLSTSLYPGCTLSGPGVSYNISAGYYEFDPSVTGLGTFTLTAFHLICGTQTQTIDVVGPEVIISPLAGSNGKYTKPSGSTITLSASQTGFISISNYTWYKNGFEISNCNACSTLTVTDAANYTVKISGTTICNGINDVKGELEVVCDCNPTSPLYGYWNNYTVGGSKKFIGSASPTNIDFVFAGILTIPAGASLSIEDANIDMEACSLIKIEAGDLNTPGGTLNLIRCRFKGCDKWQGIVVEGNPNYDHSSTQISAHGSIVWGDAYSIKDALFGIYSVNGGVVHVGGILFENNNTHIAFVDYLYDHQPFFSSNYIKGNWINNNMENCGHPYSYQSLENTIFKKMVYCNNVRDFNFDFNHYEGNTYFGQSNNYITNAIELNNTENVNTNSEEFGGFFNSSYFLRNCSNALDQTNINAPKPKFVSGFNYVHNNYNMNVIANNVIDIENCEKMVFGQHPSSVPFITNQINGKYNYAFKNSAGAYIYLLGSSMNYYSSPPTIPQNIINGVNFENITGYSMVGSCIMDGSASGIRLKNCTNSYIVGNTLSNFNTGIQFYNNQNLSTNHYINSNTISNSMYGLLISPNENPVTATYSANNYSPTIPVQFSCNGFINNKHAIIGSGNIPDQGDLNTTAGNYFVNISDWRLAWMDYDKPTITNYFCNDKPVLGGTENAERVATNNNILINNVTVSYTSVIFEININAISSPPFRLSTCSYQKTGTSGVTLLQKPSSDFSYSNHTISCPNTYLSVYDCLGKVLITGYETIDVSSLSAGIYVVRHNGFSRKITLTK